MVTTLSGCWFPNHHLVHPETCPEGLVTLAEDLTQGDLLIHLEGARPPGPGPFPAVLVHPEGGKTAAEMNGVVWDLAARGYVAIAADYQRRIDGEYRRSLFAWHSTDDVIAALAVVERQPEVDRGRIATLGFSQGGVYSLLIAAHAPERVRAVVAYYPVTDFPHWLTTPRANPLRCWVQSVIRWYFRRESHAQSEEAFQQMLRAASPYYVAKSIRAPVLLVHGDSDTTAPVEESQRMAERLEANGCEVRLLIVPGGVHIFNFRQHDKAAAAWAATLSWLATHLQP